MCWVMPPASPAATSVRRIASSSDVLPWSTWPMTTTTGARATRSASSSSNSSARSASSSACTMLTLRSISPAISSIASSERDCVMVAISPRPMSSLMICAVETSRISAKSLTVEPEGTSTSGMSAGATTTTGFSSARGPGRPPRRSRPWGAGPRRPACGSMTTRRRLPRGPPPLPVAPGTPPAGRPPWPAGRGPWPWPWPLGRALGPVGPVGRGRSDPAAAPGPVGPVGRGRSDPGGGLLA